MYDCLKSLVSNLIQSYDVQRDVHSRDVRDLIGAAIIYLHGDMNRSGV